MTTTIKYNEKEYQCSSDAHISNDGKTYQSFFEDENGDTYQVFWAITHEDLENCEDESEMCDWDKYTVVKL